MKHITIAAINIIACIGLLCLAIFFFISIGWILNENAITTDEDIFASIALAVGGVISLFLSNGCGHYAQYHIQDYNYENKEVE